MLDFIIFTVIIIVIFAGMGWYSLQQSKHKNRVYLAQAKVDAEQRKVAAGKEFNALLKQEVTQQQIDTHESTADDEPNVSILSATIEIASSIDIVEDTAGITLDLVEDTADITLDIVEPQVADVNTADIINDWDMMIAFTILAHEGTSLSGLDIKIVLENLGFYYGEMDIFHRLSADSSKQPLFSVSNMTELGTLKPDELTSMTTPGLLMFAKFPAPIDSMTLFEELFRTATTVADKLGGVLCDEAQQPANQDTIESMRGRILKMNLTSHIENN